MENMTADNPTMADETDSPDSNQQMESPNRANLDVPIPVLPPLDLGVAEPLSRRYDILVHGIQAWYTQVWPMSAYRFPANILTPETLEEYIDITGDPTRGDKELYASTFPSSATTIYTPRHQSDLRSFSGAMNADNKREIDAIKSVAHEMVHMANPVAYKGETEELAVECSVELCSLVFMGQHMPFDGKPDKLHQMLSQLAFYQNRIELWSEIMVAITGSGQEAVELCKVIAYSHPDQALDSVVERTASTFEARPPDVIDLILTDPSLYDQGLKTLAGKIKAKAQVICDAPSESLLWLIGNTRLL